MIKYGVAYTYQDFNKQILFESAFFMPKILILSELHMSDIVCRNCILVELHKLLNLLY